ncbi:SLAM family member 5 [Xenopus tropicalis]|uniref:SLAM family member 5 n=5 Tax=Xenopus tropicalis TaxID=8364 RepID=A0A8J1IUT4_XENTR|nr:SLAM family member 5 [Xenopus tropicalis]
MPSGYLFFIFILIHMSVPRSVFCSKQCGPLIKIVQAERGDALLQVNVTGTKDVYWNVISQDRSFAKTKPNGELDIRNNHYQGRLQGLNDSSLVISNLTRRDQANYTADINGDTLKCNQHYSLLVYKVLTGNDIQISNGSRGNETCNVTLTCEVNRLVGEDVTIAWNKTNIEYSKDPTIHLYNGEANSTYSCIAQNPVSAAYRSIEPSIFCPEQKRETPSKRNNNRHHIFWIPVVLILILLFAVVIIRRLNIGSSFFGFFQDE